MILSSEHPTEEDMEDDRYPIHSDIWKFTKKPWTYTVSFMLDISLLREVINPFRIEQDEGEIFVGRLRGVS